MLLKGIYVLFASRIQTHYTRTHICTECTETTGQHAMRQRLYAGTERQLSWLEFNRIATDNTRSSSNLGPEISCSACGQGNLLAYSFKRLRSRFFVVVSLYFARGVKYRRTVLISRTEHVLRLLHIHSYCFRNNSWQQQRRRRQRQPLRPVRPCFRTLIISDTSHSRTTMCLTTRCDANVSVSSSKKRMVEFRREMISTPSWHQPSLCSRHIASCLPCDT